MYNNNCIYYTRKSHVPTLHLIIKQSNNNVIMRIREQQTLYYTQALTHTHTHTHTPNL